MPCRAVPTRPRSLGLPLPQANTPASAPLGFSIEHATGCRHRIASVSQNTWLEPEAGCALGHRPFTCWYTRSAVGRLMTVVGRLLSCRAARSFIAATASAETSPALCALLQNYTAEQQVVVHIAPPGEGAWNFA